MAAAEGQSTPTLGPDSAAQDAIPPAAQQERGRSPADGSVRGSGEPEKPDAGGAE